MLKAAILCLLPNNNCFVLPQILQLEMERLSLSKAVSDKASKQRLQALDGQLKKLKAEQVQSKTVQVTTPQAVLYSTP